MCRFNKFNCTYFYYLFIFHFRIVVIGAVAVVAAVDDAARATTIFGESENVDATLVPACRATAKRLKLGMAAMECQVPKTERNAATLILLCCAATAAVAVASTA